MNQEHFETLKRTGDWVFVAGVPALMVHWTLSDVYTSLGIAWLAVRFVEWFCLALPKLVTVVRRRLGI